MDNRWLTGILGVWVEENSMTSETAEAVRERALELIERAPTWHEYRRLLDAEGLVDRLGADGMLGVLDAWHSRAAVALSDVELRIELGFWAEGGCYADHLKGFQAIPPTHLVAQAQVRGWFVRVGSSGTAVVNPPGARPLAIKLAPGS